MDIEYHWNGEKLYTQKIQMQTNNDNNNDNNNNNNNNDNNNNDNKRFIYIASITLYRVSQVNYFC